MTAQLLKTFALLAGDTAAVTPPELRPGPSPLPTTPRISRGSCGTDVASDEEREQELEAFIERVRSTCQDKATIKAWERSIPLRRLTSRQRRVIQKQNSHRTRTTKLLEALIRNEGDAAADAPDGAARRPAPSLAAFRASGNPFRESARRRVADSKHARFGAHPLLQLPQLKHDAPPLHLPELRRSCGGSMATHPPNASQASPKAWSRTTQQPRSILTAAKPAADAPAADEKTTETASSGVPLRDTSSTGRLSSPLLSDVLSARCLTAMVAESGPGTREPTGQNAGTAPGANVNSGGAQGRVGRFAGISERRRASIMLPCASGEALASAPTASALSALSSAGLGAGAQPAAVQARGSRRRSMLEGPAAVQFAASLPLRGAHSLCAARATSDDDATKRRGPGVGSMVAWGDAPCLDDDRARNGFLSPSASELKAISSFASARTAQSSRTASVAASKVPRAVGLAAPPKAALKGEFVVSTCEVQNNNVSVAKRDALLALAVAAGHRVLDLRKLINIYDRTTNFSTQDEKEAEASLAQIKVKAGAVNVRALMGRAGIVRVGGRLTHGSLMRMAAKHQLLVAKYKSPALARTLLEAELEDSVCIQKVCTDYSTLGDGIVCGPRTQEDWIRSHGDCRVPLVLGTECHSVRSTAR